jgi:SAM-dependent methyltransferase
MMKHLKTVAKGAARKGLPLALRKKVCVMMEQHRWFTEDVRYWWTRELLRDYQESDGNGYHRFLWSNHLAYAHSYEVEKRFGAEKMVGSRRLFFRMLGEVLRQQELPCDGVRSVFEVGCSLGYQLRYLETELFPQAEALVGIDIDGHAIDRGSAYLHSVGSRIRLSCADMGELPTVFGGRIYDLVLCTGVLMYLRQEDAATVVGEIMKGCRLAAFSGLGHPEIDNSLLRNSCIRGRDGSFIHNIDAMVTLAGGEVVARQWDGKADIEGQNIYFVFARPKR